jgi:hypothetical protein
MPTEKTDDRLDLLRITNEDLHYVADEWRDGISDAALRRGSVVLRRLIVQQELQRAWKVAGFAKQPKITTMSLDHMLADEHPSRIIFAVAGGAEFGGFSAAGMMAVNYAKTEKQLRSAPEAGVPERVLGLAEFGNGTCIVTNGVKISRRVLIKYIANKKGGAHFDATRSQQHEERGFAALDEFLERQQVEIASKNAIYYELLSAGQSLAKSTDVLELRQRIRKVCGDR